MLAASNQGLNPFQHYLIPDESMWVRFCMKKAAVFSEKSNPLIAHLVPVVLAVISVALSALNTLTYILRMPFRILINVIYLNPFTLVRDFLVDVTNAARSFVFVSLGMTFVVAGLLFPKAIFTHFSPDYCERIEVRQKEEIESLKKEIARVAKEKKEYGKQLELATLEIQKLKKS